jgi:hypothetical protein
VVGHHPTAQPIARLVGDDFRVEPRHGRAHYRPPANRQALEGRVEAGKLSRWAMAAAASLREASAR